MRRGKTFLPQINPARRAIAFCLLFVFGFQLVQPTISWAVTGGPVDLNVLGYQSPAATENVNHVTGSFNYTIPITSVPQYPMAYSYRPGLGMDAPASTFGFSGNSFSGSVFRSLQGLPDDLKGDEIIYDYTNQKNYGIYGGFSASLSDMVVGGGGQPGAGIEISPRIGLTVGFDNYTGVFASVSLSGTYGVAEVLKDKVKVGLGASWTNDSRDVGTSFSLGFSIEVAENKNDKFLQKGIRDFVNNMSKAAGLRVSSKKRAGSHWSAFGSSWKEVSTSNVISSYLTSLAPYSIDQSASTYASSINISVPVSTGLTVSGGYYQINAGNDYKNVKAYGSMYLKDFKSANNGSNTGGENLMADSYSEGSPKVNKNEVNEHIKPTQIQSDIYNVSGGAMAGSLDLFQTQYGIVNRPSEYENHISRTLIANSFKRNEIQAWRRTYDTGFNYPDNILDFFKKVTGSGFLFETLSGNGSTFNPIDDYISRQELAIPTQATDVYDFSTETKLRLRGDKYGEVRVTKNGEDYQVNNFDLVQSNFLGVGATDSRDPFLFGVESNAPLYVPFASSVINNNAPTKVQGSSNVQKWTFGDVSTSLSSIEAKASSLDIYHHYASTSTGKAKTDPEHVLTTTEKAELFVYKELLEEEENLDAKVARIDMVANNGMKYIYALPVLAREQVYSRVGPKGTGAPQIDGSVYTSSGGECRACLTKRDDFVYPYTWNLTAIVGPDYIDIDDIIGPSDGDIGYWVKFKYVRAQKDYKWRTPFLGMDHDPGDFQNVEDDSYSVVQGQKEIYYLYEVESSTHKTRYKYTARLDGFEAPGGLTQELPLFGATTTVPVDLYNGKVENSLLKPEDENKSMNHIGDESLYACTEIALYKKFPYGDHGLPLIDKANAGTWVDRKISSTEFRYDYSVSSEVPNHYNYHVASSSAKRKRSNTNFYDSPDGQIVNTGKLTLRSVRQNRYTYNEATRELTKHAFPSYDMHYTFDGGHSEFNPSYDAKSIDIWGNYRKNSHYEFSPGGAKVYMTNTEYKKQEADKNAKVFKLSRVDLPSGGSFNVDYETNEYSFVADEKPYEMRKIQAIDVEYESGSPLLGAGTLYVTFDVSDLEPNFDPKRMFKEGGTVYINAAYLLEKVNKGAEANDIKLVSGEYTYDGDPIVNQNGSATIALKRKEDPFPQGQCYEYAMSVSPGMMGVKRAFPITNSSVVRNATAHVTEQSMDSGLDAIGRLVKNSISTLLPDPLKQSVYENTYEDVFGVPCEDLIPELSAIRCRIPHAKYTGYRVKSISVEDNFNYATNAQNPGVPVPENKVYTTEYDYNWYQSLDGKETTQYSSGVASLEPGTGKDRVFDVAELSGNSFLPSPAIYYASVRVKTGKTAPWDATVQDNDEVSRPHRFTQYRFMVPGRNKNAYTTVDGQTKKMDLRFASNFKKGQHKITSDKYSFSMLSLFDFYWLRIKILSKKVKIPIPMFVPMAIHYKRHDNYNLRSYVYRDMTDYYGQTLSIAEYEENLDGTRGTELSKTEFDYFDPSSNSDRGHIKVVSKSNFNGSQWPQEEEANWPGSTEKSWGESHMRINDDINRYLHFVILGKSSFNYFLSDHREISYPPLLRGISKTQFGVKEVTKNEVFDKKTMQTLQISQSQTIKNDEAPREVITRNYPAYWYHDELDLQVDRTGGMNQVFPIMKSYAYLNTDEDETNDYDGQFLISASRSVWAKPGDGTWSYGDIIVENDGEFETSTRSVEAVPGYQSADQLTSSFYIYKRVEDVANQRATNGWSAWTNYTPVSEILQPYENYVADVPLKLDGTFDLPAAFDEQADMKLVNRITKYDANGSPIEVEDILGKRAVSKPANRNNYTEASFVNASNEEAIYAGAENAYPIAPTTYILDDKLWNIGEARILGANCLYEAKTFQADEILESESNTSNEAQNAIDDARFVYNLSVNQSDFDNTYAKLDATTGHYEPVAVVKANLNFNIVTNLYFYLNVDGKLEIRNAKGDPFNTFVYLKSVDTQNNKVNYKIFFAHEDFNSNAQNKLEFDANHLPTGVTLNKESGVNAYRSCNIARNYMVPTLDCAPSIHSGEYVFKLDANQGGNAVGTEGTVEVQPSRDYRAVAWFHVTSPDATRFVVTDDQGQELYSLSMSDYLAGNNSTSFVRIDDWIRFYIHIPSSVIASAGTSQLKVKVLNELANGGTAYYDDVLLAPLHAAFSANALSHRYDQVISTLDNELFATKYIYDEYGRLIQVSTEVEQVGEQVLQQKKYNFQKKP